MFPVHENETGSFQELAKSNEVSFGQLGILTINPKCSRGNHYHTRKEEWFCCIHGRCELKIKNVNDDFEKNIILDDNKRKFVKVKPYENHIIKNIIMKINRSVKNYIFLPIYIYLAISQFICSIKHNIYIRCPIDVKIAKSTIFFS